MEIVVQFESAKGNVIQGQTKLLRVPQPQKVESVPGKCRQHHHRKLAIIFFAVAPMVGCNPRQPSSETPKPVPARATSSSHQSALSPLETIRALHEFRNSGRYAEMQDLIVPDYRTENS